MSNLIKSNKVYKKQDGEISIFDKDTVPSVLNDEIKPGFYKVGSRQSMMGPRPCLEVMDEPIYPESTKHLSNEYFNKEYINNYFSENVREFHKILSIKHKLGILLHGIPGTGKTSAAYDFAKEIIANHNAIVITVNDYSEYAFVDGFINEYRKISNQMVMIVFDECEYYLDNYDSYFKRKLDSNESIENVLSVFITNEFEEIPRSISKRPSRIKFSTEIKGLENKEIIEIIIKDFTKPLNDTSFGGTNNYLDLAIDHILEGNSTPTIDDVKNGYLDYMLNALCMTK